MEATPASGGFHAAYFPYSRMRSASALRRACFLFDSVTVLEPNEVDFWMTPEHDRKHLAGAVTDLAQWREDTDALRDARVLRAVTIETPTALSGPGEDLWWLLDAERDRTSAWNHGRVPQWARFLVHLREQRGAVPVTDDPVWEKTIRATFPVSSTLQGARWETDSTAATLALHVFESSVPAFETRSYEDVLSLRETLDDALTQYRTYMTAAAAKIRSRPWDDDYPREVAALVAAEVEPALLELRQEAEALPKQRASIAAKAILSYKPLAIVGTVFIGVPPEVAALAAAGLTAADVYLDMQSADRAVNEHGLALLIRGDVQAA